MGPKGRTKHAAVSQAEVVTPTQRCSPEINLAGDEENGAVGKYQDKERHWR